MLPVGFEKETSWRWTVGEKGQRQARGEWAGVCCVVGSQNPPMPALEASVAPIQVGAIGTKADSGTGC